MGRGLAFRRHQDKIHKEKAKRKLIEMWNWTPPDASEKYNYDPAVVAIHAKTPKLCSCWMCGNPRRNGEKPIAELKADDDEKEQITEDLRVSDV